MPRKASGVDTNRPAARLNTGQLVKSYWSFVNKSDVAGLEVLLARHGHSLDMDSRLPAAMQATGLHVAVQKNNAAMVALLLQHGVHVNAQNKVGSTALHLACKQGNIDVLQLLIDADADFGILDASNRAPCEFAAWQIMVDAIVKPLQEQVAALQASEHNSRTLHERLDVETARLHAEAHATEMAVEDVTSQRLEEWMAFRAKCQMQDDRRGHLVLAKRTLQRLDDDIRTQRSIGNDLHAELEEALFRYQYAIAQADAAKALLEREVESVAQMHRVKDDHTTEYNGKLGVVDAMLQCPNDEDVQVWGAYMACCMTEDASATNSMPWRLVNQRIFPALRDAMERFPLCAILQEHAINAVRQICVAQPPAIDQCMHHKFVENIQAAARRFHDNVPFLSLCVGALRAILSPFAPGQRSAIQIKHTAKFASDHNEYLVRLFVRAKTERMPSPSVVEDLCCVLFVLAKYNCRHLFLDDECVGLETALFFLVHPNRPGECMARSLLGIVSLLSIADSKTPELAPLPPCYTSFGLAKITPLLQAYAGNPDIVLWGIRLLRNLAVRDAVARDQVNRSGIERILSGMATHRGAPAMRVSILELIHAAFTTNYSRFQQVEELSTMVLQCMLVCFLDHEDNLSVQEWALKNMVVAAQHASNLEFLMESKDVIGPSLVVLLHQAANRMAAHPAATVGDSIMVWGLRFVVAMWQYDRVRDPVDFSLRAKSSGVVMLLASIETLDERIQNLINVVRCMLCDGAS
ncbi:hypothetical protein H310_08924 [Aphanomyces invadans]|uniref:Uncharacterized protein n=1 Tax=Aphanomyces invadans TaxID=157072 RepID=A0A024TVZ4_9STRA|nr:hypothetical protein H310_08924 [Aphanomyces invadans]ETV98198.1 hypothetical protein H310_08924 [Aphanomyces invadans]|eukprot:XP_008873073.1 hypothetical protein H310_08924 [Aphanomyces invadans]